MPRPAPGRQHADKTAVARALSAVVGRKAVGAKPDDPDLIVTLPDGRTLAIEVKSVSRAEPGPIANALRTWEPDLRRRRGAHDAAVVGIVVASSVAEATKNILREHGWGWLDRRGELHIEAPGLFVHDTDVAPPRRANDDRGRKPIRGRSGIGTAAALLLWPDDPPGTREIARRCGLSPSSVSEALRSLRGASLVRSDNRPLIPEAFWALADVWNPPSLALARAPDVDGLVVGGTVAALAWGAPLVVTADYPPDYYTREDVDLRALRYEYGAPAEADTRACTVTVAPTQLLLSEYVERPGAAHPLVHPLFAALDLARDKARGVEALEVWSPPPPYKRLW